LKAKTRPYHRPYLPREGMYFCVIFCHYKVIESDSPCGLISAKYEINGKESIAQKALISDIDFRAQTSIVGNFIVGDYSI